MLEKIFGEQMLLPVSLENTVIGCAQKEMDILTQEFNWISYFPYPDETPILLPDLDSPPLFGKIVTLGEILNNPAFSSLHQDLKLLQRFLRTSSEGLSG